MKNDNTRDYITHVFQKYARYGEPNFENARAALAREALKTAKGDTPERVILNAERALERHTPLLMDILAAERTMQLLEQGERNMIAGAVRAVYMAEPQKQLRSREIAARVRRYAAEAPADPATVYRWLKEARRLCAAIRGLNGGDAEGERIIKAAR